MKVFWAVLIVFSTFFTDLPTKEFFGEFGRTLTNLLLPVWALVVLLNAKKNSKLLKWTIIFLSLVGFQMFLGNLYYLVSANGAPVIRGEHIITKNFKLMMYLLSNLFFAISIVSLFSSSIDLRRLLKVSYLGFLVLSIVTIIEFIDPSVFSYVHAREFSRIPRLFTAEPSWTNYLINSLFVSSVLYFYLYKRTSCVFYTILCTQVFFLLTSTSKLFLVFGSLNLVLFLMYQTYQTKTSRFGKILLLFIVIVISFAISFFVFLKFSRQILIDIEKFTSVATRIGTNLGLILYLFKYPIAFGAVYLYYFPTCIEKIYQIFEKIGLNVSEMQMYLFSFTEGGMTVKGGWGSLMIYYGVISLILMLLFLFKLLYMLKHVPQAHSRLLYYFFLLNLLIVAIFDNIISRPHFWYILALAYIVVNTKDLPNIQKGLHYLKRRTKFAIKNRIYPSKL